MPLEERLNAWSHGLGVGFGIAALILLLLGVDTNNPWVLFSVVVNGLSIILLFLASTCYHAITSSKRKHYFRIADHIGIYFLIAGTNHIERMHLTLRTHLKRLHRRSIGYSRSVALLSATVKIYFWS